MQLAIESAIQKYIQLKGTAAYEKLYHKINESNALTEICGISAREKLPPTANDFVYKVTTMPSMLFVFDNAKLMIAAIIMLKIWNERINSFHHFCTEEIVDRIADQIASKSIYLRRF